MILSSIFKSKFLHINVVNNKEGMFSGQEINSLIRNTKVEEFLEGLKCQLGNH